MLPVSDDEYRESTFNLVKRPLSCGPAWERRRALSCKMNLEKVRQLLPNKCVIRFPVIRSLLVGMSRPRQSPDRHYQTTGQPQRALICSSLQIGGRESRHLHFRRNGAAKTVSEIEVRQLSKFATAGTKSKWHVRRRDRRTHGH
jgi:hypothetical protein